MIFAQFPYDYALLWTKTESAEAFIEQVDAHLRLLHNSPPLIARMLNIMVGVGFLGFFIKLFRASEANMLFDGASLVMYVIGVGLYAANIVKALRMVSADYWNSPEYLERQLPNAPDAPPGQPLILNKPDSFKVLAASDTILALVLVGIIVLQVGQWYAERKELQELEKAQEAGAGSEGFTKPDGSSTAPASSAPPQEPYHFQVVEEEAVIRRLLGCLFLSINFHVYVSLCVRVFVCVACLYRMRMAHILRYPTEPFFTPYISATTN